MSQTPIDYARPLPIHRRKRIQRAAIFVIVVLALGYLGYMTAPQVWRHAALLYWQNKALNYSGPADQIVFDDSPDAFKGLEQPSEIVPLSDGQGRVALAAKRFFTVLFHWGLYRHDSATLFLHGRKNSLGRVRLVRVTGLGTFKTRYIDGSPPVKTFMVSADVYQPGALFSDPLELQELGPHLASFDFQSADQPLRVFAGQSQLNDPSHFSIACEIGGKRFVIDGWLLDDDTVKLAMRH